MKRIFVLLLCALMMFASVGMVAGAAETEPTIDTVAEPLMYEKMVAQITEQSNVQVDSTEISFITGREGFVKIKVGVPVSGLYNVSALLKSSDGSANLDGDLILTTYRGEKFTYSRTTRGGNWTYAPANMYLEKGDRILTFQANPSGGNNIIMNGVRLYNITNAFVAGENLTYDILTGNSVTITAGELFTPNIGVGGINSKKVVLSAPGAKVAVNTADWTKTEITLSKAGTYQIRISDDVYGNVVKATVTAVMSIETVPTFDTVAKPAMNAEFVPLVTEVTNATKDTTSVTFVNGKDNTVKVKVGVPVTGYYNVSALLKAGDGASILYNDLTLTTDRGESFTYARETRGGNWTYAPANVYLVRGDRILTFRANMTSGKQIVMNGIRLYHMTKAFYALENLTAEIPAGAANVAVTADQLFLTDIGVAVNSSEVEITAPGAEVSLNKDDWKKSAIIFSEAGKYNVTIQDKFYGGAATATITVTKAAVVVPGETEPTFDTVAKPAMNAEFVPLITGVTNATKGATNVIFVNGKDNIVNIKVGVPETGYYNVSALLKAGDGASILYNDLTLTTDLGDSFTYARETRGGSWTYAPANVYLLKGDRILTFRANMTSGKQIVMNGIRLYHMTKAFYALNNLEFNIPAGAASVTVTADKLFATEIGVAVNSAEVEITASGATVSKDAADWTKSTITFAKAGTYTVNIKDVFYGGVTTATVTIK